MPRLLHDLAIHFLVKWRAAGRELAQWMILLTHQEGAVRQSFADSPFIELSLFKRIGGKIRIGQNAAPQAQKTDVPVEYVLRAGVDGVSLQPTVAGGRHG